MHFIHEESLRWRNSWIQSKQVAMAENVEEWMKWYYNEAYEEEMMRVALIGCRKIGRMLVSVTVISVSYIVWMYSHNIETWFNEYLAHYGYEKSSISIS